MTDWARNGLAVLAASFDDTSTRGHRALLVSALSLTVFAFAVRTWWLESVQTAADEHQEFEHLVEEQVAGRTEPGYAALITLAMQLGYVRTNFDCDITPRPHACDVAYELIELARSTPVADEPPVPVCEKRHGERTWRVVRGGGDDDDIVVPDFITLSASAAHASVPRCSDPPSDSAAAVRNRPARAIAWWRAFRRRLDAEPAEHHEPRPRDQPTSDDDARYAQVYLVSVDGIIGLRSQRGGRPARHYLGAGPDIDLRGRPYVHESRGRRDWSQRYTSLPYLDLAGFGAVRTECIGIHGRATPQTDAGLTGADSGAAAATTCEPPAACGGCDAGPPPPRALDDGDYLGALCVDYTLPVGRPTPSPLAQHALVRYRPGDGTVHFEGEDAWLTREDRATVRRHLAGEAHRLRRAFREALDHARLASDGGVELNASTLADEVVADVASRDRSVAFEEVIPMGGRSSEFWALIPLRRILRHSGPQQDEELQFVLIRPQVESEPLSLYLAALAGLLAVVACTLSIRGRVVARRRESEAGVLQSLQVGVIRGDGALNVLAANDRAEELLERTLPGIEEGGDAVPASDLFEDEVLEVRDEIASALADRFTKTTLEDVERSRLQGITSTYYVRRKQTTHGTAPKFRWLRVRGSPALFPGAAPGTFATLGPVEPEIEWLLDVAQRSVPNTPEGP